MGYLLTLSVGKIIYMDECGLLVQWHWQGKAEVLGEKPVPLLLCAQHIPRGLSRDWTWASAVRGRRLTASAMERPAVDVICCHPSGHSRFDRLDSFISWEGKKGFSATGLDRPVGFQEVEAPEFIDNRHMKVVRLSALRTGRLYPRKDSWYSFLLEAESAPGPQCDRKE
jgi:hypothetical protein